MVRCDYCGELAELVSGERIYPHRKDLYYLKFYRCEPCDAHVGCHKPNGRLGYKGDEPLGVLANKDLRRLKSDAHKSFDPLWKNKHFKSRKRAYNWLANILNINVKDCHIGLFDAELCKRVIEVTSDKRLKLLFKKEG